MIKIGPKIIIDQCKSGHVDPQWCELEKCDLLNGSDLGWSPNHTPAMGLAHVISPNPFATSSFF